MSSEKENIRNELREIAPGLEKLQGKNPFQVPEGYFEFLPYSIPKNKKESSKSPAFIPVFKNSFARYAVSAFAILIIITVGFFVVRNSMHSSYLTMDEEVYFDEYLAWYSVYQQDVYYDIILENGYIEEAGQYNDQLTDDDLIEYLMDYTHYYQHDLPDLDWESEYFE